MTSTEATQSRIQEIEEQQRTLVFNTFDNDDAWRLGASLMELGQDRNLPITIQIRRNGHLLFHAARPGTTPDNDTWVARKAHVVDRFGAPSYLVRLRAIANGTTFEQATGLPMSDYAAHGGSFPITVARVGIVGTVTVSGLPQSDDHDLAVEAITALLSSPHERTHND